LTEDSIVNEHKSNLDIKHLPIELRNLTTIVIVICANLTQIKIKTRTNPNSVPAAKLARREGIDFILDPLHSPIKPDLFEHIDGLYTCDSHFK